MNEARAIALQAELQGAPVGGWKITGYLDNGKSAAVFVATNDAGEQAALKIFEPELVEEYGRGQQLDRIQRELTLVGESHPNLIRVLDGGECGATNHLYVVTELLEGWTNVQRSLSEVPVESVPALIEQVASAAAFLHDRGIVHRDIKPANVVLSPDYSQAVLLDLGVIRILDADPSTSRDDFIGTLQYSSPEFLVREEQDTPRGGLALTFYQLGALLHDLLVRKPLFGEFSPYAKMVEAVRTVVPTFPEGLDPGLVKVARNCLLKDPEQRLQLVSWSDFSRRDRDTIPSTERLRQRIRSRVSGVAEPQPSYGSQAGFERSVAHAKARLQDLCTAESSIPPIVIRQSRESEARFRIELDLAASEVHRIPFKITVRFCLEADPSSDEVATVTASASRSDSAEGSGVGIQFASPVDPSALSQEMFHRVLLTIDAAQTQEGELTPFLQTDGEEA